jgi:hypothetical protein
MKPLSIRIFAALLGGWPGKTSLLSEADQHFGPGFSGEAIPFHSSKPDALIWWPNDHMA